MMLLRRKAMAKTLLLASALASAAVPSASLAEPAAVLATESGPRDMGAPSVWYRDTWGGILLGTGIATMGVGLYLLSSAGGTSDEAGRAQTYDRYVALSDSADTRQVAGEVVLISGLLLGVGAVVRYLMVRSDAAPAAAMTGRPLGLRSIALPFQLLHRF